MRLFLFVLALVFYFNSSIAQTWNPNGITVAGGNGAGSAPNQLNFANGICVSSSGDIYIVEETNHRVSRWSSPFVSGIVVAGGNGNGSQSNQLSYPQALFVDANQNIYVADANNHRVQKWSPPYFSGITVAGGNGAGNNANQLNYPIGVYVDLSGQLYVADYYNHRVQRWAINAVTGVTVAGGNGAGANANQLNFPRGVFVDAQQHIWISDLQNNRVQKWAPPYLTGTTVAGGNGVGANMNQLNGPTGLYVQSNGDLFIADFYNHRIQRWVAPNYQIGNVVVGGNGKGANVNQLADPASVAFDTQGNLYVCDKVNNRIQKFTQLQPSSSGNAESTMRIYPNPASHELNIENAQGAMLVLYDLSGKEKIRRFLKSEYERVNISQVANGVYIYKLMGSNLHFTGKLIKN